MQRALLAIIGTALALGSVGWVHAAEAPVYKDWNDVLRNAPAAPEPQAQWRTTAPGQAPDKSLAA